MNIKELLEFCTELIRERERENTKIFTPDINFLPYNYLLPPGDNPVAVNKYDYYYY
jgi:hypothetical protein